MAFPIDPRLLGAKPRPHDPRERRYAFAPSADIDLSVAYSLLPWSPFWVFDQGQMGSCTANAASMAAIIIQYTAGVADPVIASRQFIYAEARIKEGTFPQDVGAYVPDALDIALPGLVPEAMEPYHADPNERPSADVEAVAASGQHKVIASHAPIYAGAPGAMVQGIAQALADGHPVQIGIDWHNGDFNPSGGILPTGAESGQSVGGHSVVIIKSVPARVGRWPLMFLAMNSWSDTWTNINDLHQVDPEIHVGGCFFIPAPLVEAGRVWDARAVIGVGATPNPAPQPQPDDTAARIMTAIGGVRKAQVIAASRGGNRTGDFYRNQGGAAVEAAAKGAEG